MAVAPPLVLATGPQRRGAKVAPRAKGCRVVFVPGNRRSLPGRLWGIPLGALRWCPMRCTPLPMAQPLGHPRRPFDGVIIAPNGWPTWATTCMNSRSSSIAILNTWRARLGLPYWSPSAVPEGKCGVNYVTDFEVAVAAEARSRGHDGVVCGHIHRAEMRGSTGPCIATMATGWRATRRWSNTWMADWSCCTGPPLLRPMCPTRPNRCPHEDRVADRCMAAPGQCRAW